MASEVRRLAHSSKEQADATAANINQAVNTISRIRTVANNTVETASNMAQHSISAADTIAAMSSKTNNERDNIVKHLSSLHALTSGMDAMQEAVAQLTVLQKLSTRQGQH